MAEKGKSTMAEKGESTMAEKGESTMAEKVSPRWLRRAAAARVTSPLRLVRRPDAADILARQWTILPLRIRPAIDPRP